MIKPPCACGGSDSMTPLIRRLLQRDPYTYSLEDDRIRRSQARRFKVELNANEGHVEQREVPVSDEPSDPTTSISSFSGTIAESGSGQDERSRGWVIWRIRKDGTGNSEGLCGCGRWIDPRAEGQKLRYQRVWRDSRVAEEFARRLRYGIPQAWEWAAAGLFITAEVVVTAVIVRFG